MEQADVTSLIPILITLFLALTTRNVVVGLFAGVVSGVAMLEGTFVSVVPPVAMYSELARSIFRVALRRWWTWRFRRSFGL